MIQTYLIRVDLKKIPIFETMRRPYLIPFVPFYSLGTRLRNALFDRGVLKSIRFETPCLVVGNLSAGGTGKTPHTEFLLGLFREKKCGVISRGYGRKSKGFFWVDADGLAETYGDEPLQIKRRFPDVPVAVCEDRVLAVPEFIGTYPDTELLIFDDAYQHRYLDAHCRIVLTEYSDLFTRDSLLPAGNLREAKKEAARADVIIVTKCPAQLDKQQQDLIEAEIRNYHQGPIFFSSFKPEDPVFPGEKVSGDFKNAAVMVFSAIANGSRWADPYMGQFKEKVGELCYPDHHRFTQRDIDLLRKKWKEFGEPLILTTEKDWMRLMKFAPQLSDLPMLYFPIRVNLLHDSKSFKGHIESTLYSHSIE
ncbi:MAG: tetraacyldisaccharide 4'-kinase [Bacteroidota bacterium]|nr:tetraacyldisaccharide 4'-kinase [Bacteroidota bacterium]MDX5429596.1 tetraacyldisaccharide 4'-kinase [Bacteroidota bacterium]MDX5468380.1 tetraacyldisaccharide 4'-kinase [Bacteroidota bacterium]